jgi:hypothetical protein
MLRWGLRRGTSRVGLQWGDQSRIVRLEGEINRPRGKVHGEGHYAGNKEQEQSKTVKSDYSPVNLVAVRLVTAF